MTRKFGEALPFYILISSLIVAIVLLLRFILIPFIPPLEELEASIGEKRKIVIDPGHGGKDGGAVSITGAEEKELNLDTSMFMRDLLRVLGYTVVMTRDRDIELTHADGGTRKMQDLKGRLEIALSNSEAVFVSIHMNKFSDPKYRGLQVYYSPNNELSRKIAGSVQHSVCQILQPNNNRKIKKADNSIFLLQKITSAAILIECGFISNPSEAELLDDDEYRNKLASVISVAITNTFERQVYEN